MTANEWRLHDALEPKFAQVLFALTHPEILSVETSEEQRADMVRHYLRNDPAAYHALRALLHIAIDESRRAYNGEAMVTALSDLVDLAAQMEASEGYETSSQVFAARAALAKARQNTGRLSPPRP